MGRRQAGWYRGSRSGLVPARRRGVGHGRHRSARAGGTNRPRRCRDERRARAGARCRARSVGARSRSRCAGSPSLDPAERGPRGAALNGVRKRLEAEHAARAEALSSVELERRLREDAVDVTLPGTAVPRGVAHLLSQTQRAIEDVFVGLGYRVAEGPEVEREYYNFTALNHAGGPPGKGRVRHVLGLAGRRPPHPDVADADQDDGAAEAARVRDRPRPGLPSRSARRDSLPSVPADRGPGRRSWV